MSEEMVRICVGRDDYEMVPISQVPADYWKVHIRDRGDCYLSPADFASLQERIQQEPFPLEVNAALQDQYDVLSAACPTIMEKKESLQDWVDGFRYDQTPWREMAIWETYAFAFRKFAGHISGSDEASVSKREDVLSLILHVSTQGIEPTPKAKYNPYKSLTANRVREIVEWFASDDHAQVFKAALKKFRAVLKERINEILPDRVGFHALFGEDMLLNRDAPFNPFEFLATADIIIAQDVNDPEKRGLAFGKERYEQLVASAVDGQVNIAGVRLLTVQLDIDTDEFGVLCVAAEATHE